MAEQIAGKDVEIATKDGRLQQLKNEMEVMEVTSEKKICTSHGPELHIQLCVDSGMQCRF